MKYIHYYILVILSLGLLSACVMEEGYTENLNEKLVKKVFTATFEESEMTKTVLDDIVGENGYRGLLWEPEDEIGIASYGRMYQPFVNIVTEPTANGIFEGNAFQSEKYFAIYPYQFEQRHESVVSVTIPTVQTYKENSFARNMAPMVGRCDDGETLHFMNPCGVLAVQLTGSEKISSITFETMEGVLVSGPCLVDTEYVDYPLLDTSTATESYVTLNCGEGVQLGGEAVPFHIVLPPGEYKGFTLYITTTDGKFMKKETSKTLTITHSVVTKAAPFDFEENMTEVTNLSEHGHSNCYVVSEAGIYSFDADIIGNGEYGIIEGVRLHTNDPSISPASVELLWEDRSGLVQAYALDAATGKVKLMTSGKEGNALIAVKDADDMILWSWHIWMTDHPADQNYENDVLGSFVMLDRNIGAIRADYVTGVEYKESIGLYYQWGRKDPFVPGHYTNHSDQFTIAESLKCPTEFGTSSNWTSEAIANFWHTDKKTIYDPCPVGYRVPIKDVWYGFTPSGGNGYVTEDQVSSTTYDNGWSFYRNKDSETAWYPATGYYTGVASHLPGASTGYYWAAGQSYYMYIGDNGYVSRDNTAYSYNGYNVRCMKDDGYEATSLPVVKQDGSSEYTTTSITFGGNVSYSGWSEITDRGFIYFTDPDMSDAQTVSCGSGTGEFSYMLEGLAPGSVCYVKAYAVNSYGTSYSDVRRYRTKYSDVDNNLSSEWVANCYIVDPSPASYCFDATIVGNGNMGYVSGEDFYPQNPVIIPSSAEILWEDTPGVISDIMLQNGMVNFMTNDLEGNAVIAVKDEGGVILWSWHIWVTDQPAEHTYVTNEGKTFVVMDRYLGSTNAEVAQNGGALYYQWGRKDPFRLNGSSLEASLRGQFANLSESISAPTYYPQGDDWVTDISTSLWSKDMKTIYDPCPEGWRVPSSEIWSGIRRLQDLDANGYGVVFGFSDTDSFWYPDAPRFNHYGNIEGSYTCDQTEVWTAEYGISYFLRYSGNYSQSRSRGDACPIRCMKDE